MPDVPADWMRDGPVWALQILGIYEDSVAKRNAEQACLADLREAGVIR